MTTLTRIFCFNLLTMTLLFPLSYESYAGGKAKVKKAQEAVKAAQLAEAKLNQEAREEKKKQETLEEALKQIEEKKQQKEAQLEKIKEDLTRNRGIQKRLAGKRSKSAKTKRSKTKQTVISLEQQEAAADEDIQKEEVAYSQMVQEQRKALETYKKQQKALEKQKKALQAAKKALGAL